MDSTRNEKPELELEDSMGEENGLDERKRLIEHVEVTCEAVLGQGKTTIGKLESLAAGDTLALDCSPADPVELRVNGKPIARGEIVTMDDRFGIRITQIG